MAERQFPLPVEMRPAEDTYSSPSYSSHPYVKDWVGGGELRHCSFECDNGLPERLCGPFGKETLQRMSEAVMLRDLIEETLNDREHYFPFAQDLETMTESAAYGPLVGLWNATTAAYIEPTEQHTGSIIRCCMKVVENGSKGLSGLKDEPELAITIPISVAPASELRNQEFPDGLATSTPEENHRLPWGSIAAVYVVKANGPTSSTKPLPTPRVSSPLTLRGRSLSSLASTITSLLSDFCFSTEAA